ILEPIWWIDIPYYILHSITLDTYRQRTCLRTWRAFFPAKKAGPALNWSRNVKRGDANLHCSSRRPLTSSALLYSLVKLLRLGPVWGLLTVQLILLVG